MPPNDPTLVTLGDVQVSARWVSMLRRHGLTSLEAMLSCNGEILDKPGLPVWRRRVRLELVDDTGAAVNLYMKRYLEPPPVEQKRRTVRGDGDLRKHGTAWNEWRWLCRLMEHGIACPEPVAFGERMDGGHEQASVLLMNSVAGESLERVAERRPGRISVEWINGVGVLVRKLHGAGFVHRDLYLSHIFVSDRASLKFALIDVARMMEPRWRWERWIVKDLAALNYSTPGHMATMTDRLRFLRVYLDVSRLSDRTKRLIGRICRKTERIAAHDRKRLKRLSDKQQPTPSHEDRG